MFNISSYLDKFKNIGLKEILLKENIVKTIKEKIGVEISVKDITLKNNVITIKMSPLLRSEVFMKKKKILDEINSNQSIKVNDIR